MLKMLRGRTPNKLLIGALLVTTIAYWVVLIFRIPAYKIIPGYFWLAMQFIDKPLGNLWLVVPMVVFSITIVSIVIKRPKFHKLNLLLLILLGYTIQMGFGLMEKQGIDGIRSRMVHTGHAEFAKIASNETNMLKIATQYEKFLEENKSLRFPKTKPPGQLLFYMFTQKISNLIAPQVTPMGRYIRLVTFASYTYPLLTYLAIIPLFYFCRLFIKKRFAILPCILYLFVPSVTLVTLHLDQVLYPALFMLCLYLVIYSCYKNSLLFFMLSGALVYLSLYISFSLLPCIPLALMFAATYYFYSNQRKNKLTRYLKVLAGFIAGMVILTITFKLLLNYDPFVRYQNATAYHQAWKAWEPGLTDTVLFAFLNYVEYACWIGLPMMVFYLTNASRAIGEIVKRQFSVMNLLSLSSLVIFVLLGFFGKTKGEVHRLWLFMVPLVCVFVCYELSHRFKHRLEWMLGFLLTMQFITTLLIKRYQDFW